MLLIDYLVFNVDEAQRGLGGAACGPGPLGKYTLSNNYNLEEYYYEFSIIKRIREESL